MPAETPVLCGIDVLQRDHFAPLRRRKIGLITNHTGLNRDGIATADLLHNAKDIELRALFAPEHGIRGALDENISDSTDLATGLPIHSLYGVRNRPTPAQLKGLDTLVFDIQDIGTRFYTYISTLGLCLEEAAKHGQEFIVLDRPNPLNGVEIEGSLPDKASLGFTAYHPIPVRHGMTTGELAHLFRAEKRLKVTLQVVMVEGWSRRQRWEETGLLWTNPSPNMRSSTQALLYPGVGLLEGTNLSVGRGTDTPFEIIGAPWIAPVSFAAYLNALDLPGVRFVPLRFTPTASVYAHLPCGGVQLVLTERERFVPVFTGLSLASALLHFHAKEWTVEKFNSLLFDKNSYKRFRDGATPLELITRWQSDLATFRERRRPYLLYA